jgi:hypothetical protein
MQGEAGGTSAGGFAAGLSPVLSLPPASLLFDRSARSSDFSPSHTVGRFSLGVQIPRGVSGVRNALPLTCDTPRSHDRDGSTSSAFPPCGRVQEGGHWTVEVGASALAEGSIQLPLTPASLSRARRSEREARQGARKSVSLNGRTPSTGCRIPRDRPPAGGPHVLALSPAFFVSRRIRAIGHATEFPRRSRRASSCRRPPPPPPSSCRVGAREA